MLDFFRSGMTLATIPPCRCSIPSTNRLSASVRSAALPFINAELAILVHIARFTANEGRINLDFAAETKRLPPDSISSRTHTLLTAATSGRWFSIFAFQTFMVFGTVWS
jgi:hypothetical protein